MGKLELVDTRQARVVGAKSRDAYMRRLAATQPALLKACKAMYKQLDELDSSGHCIVDNEMMVMCDNAIAAVEEVTP